MIRKLGKKGLEWKRERLKRIKELEATGGYTILGTLLFGHCLDCGRYKCLDLDHREGRHGEDPHALSKLDAVCRECHQQRHLRNHMPQKDKKDDTSKSKKADWAKDHKCKHCKEIVSTLLCTNCQKISI